MKTTGAATKISTWISHLSTKKKQVNVFLRVKIVIAINFWDKKVIFILFYVKDVNKTVPYYFTIKPVFWETSLSKKVTY